MSNLLKEKRALTKLREELEGRKEKMCRSCKGFRHLAHNCRNKREEEKGIVVPQNKFGVLGSRVMQCGVEERVIRRQELIMVECFKCGKKGHKCRECPLWRKMKEERKLRRVEEEEVACVARPQKAQQEGKPACPTREKAQEWQRSSVAELRKKAEEHCGKGVLEEA